MPPSLRSSAGHQPLDVLACEPYLTGSHRAWVEGLETHSRHRVTVVSLPGRWWKWRMRGGAVTLAERCGELAAGGYRPDVIVATGMVDLAAFRGLVPDAWRTIPVLLYLHESQLTYPESPRSAPDLSYAFTNWTSALAADAVAFNSPFHRDTFFANLPRLLSRFPDLTHHHRVDGVRASSGVLPVGVDLSWLGERRSGGEPPLVVWNHRWEHDKDPDAFAEAVDRVVAGGSELRLALLGARTPSEHPALQRLRERHPGRIVVDEEAPVDRYREVLARADVVVSTALQEFFGIAVVEAVAAGAVPVLPRRLSYPWLLPADTHDHCLYDTDPVPSLARLLADAGLRRRLTARLAPALRRFDWPLLIDRYDRILETLAAGENPRFERQGGEGRV